MSIARHHAEWLSLLEISGPFLSMPVLLDAFPQGLDTHDADHAAELRSAYEEWLDNQQGLQRDQAIHTAWLRYVLTTTLEFDEGVSLLHGQAIPESIKAVLPERHDVIRPDWMVVDPADNKPVLLVATYPLDQDLDERLKGESIKDSPATRMMELLHATQVPLGLVTNGERWMLVSARPGETTGYVSWYASLWGEEQITLRAFRTLLGVYRFFGVSEDETLAALLERSSQEQHEVTDQLGHQVRQAVEMLIQAWDATDEASGRVLLEGVNEARLYDAALTVMMRLVFLLSAEERDLLLLGDPLYDAHYAVSTLRAQLREAADQLGEDVLTHRFDAWSRLLATFRAVYGGVWHEDLRLPAYGGSLFDPDRFPFLEGRREGLPPGIGGDRRGDLPPGTGLGREGSHPIPVDNRTVLYLLEALQRLQVKVPGGGPATARLLSFRALDIEQIGHVYEGLLDHQAIRAAETVLGMEGTKNKEPEIPLATLDSLLQQGEKKLVEYLKGETGRSVGALRNGLQTELDEQRKQRLRAACGNDENLYKSVLPFAGLVRDDDFGYPVVIPAGSIYVTAGSERRDTGTHYTPRSLTEPIVQHTLEPLVYNGPAEGKPRDQWRLRAPEKLLDLKICDMAMGSGAFLVQACRYLADRIVEAWETENARYDRQGANNDKKEADPSFASLRSLREENSVFESLRAAENPSERLVMARRLVADRCLYGVDKNPLAVEMAKLSLWLITMSRGKPFTFLDHALRCGDSLVGISHTDQLLVWSLDGKGDRAFETLSIASTIEKVINLRQEIANSPVLDPTDQELKSLLLHDAEALTNDLRTGADMLVGSYYNDLSKSDQESLRSALLKAFRDGTDVASQHARQAALDDVSAFHWPLEFPEVFLTEGRDGFDAFIGNPPFLGGRRIRSTLGDQYRSIIYDLYPGSSGNADLSAFFFLRGFHNLQHAGTLGLIATNTISQGDTLETGLAKIVEEEGTIYRATNNQPWPGQAAVVVNVVHLARGTMQKPFVLDGRSVRYISGRLDSARVSGNPYSLEANQGKSFQGSVVVGTGFLLSPEEAQTLIAKNPHNKDVLYPYLNGQDLNSNPDQSPSRWAINFFDWPLERGAKGSWLTADKKQQREWLRSGRVPNDYPDPVAADYPDCLEIVRREVYPVRAEVNRKAHRDYWWHYGDKRPALYETIAPLQRVLVCSRVSKFLSFSFVPLGQVYSEATVVVASERNRDFAILSSDLHEAWARKYTSSLETRLRYSPTDALENYPFPYLMPKHDQALDQVGELYQDCRRQLMLDRQEGLTATYNRFHSPDETAEDIAKLRSLHIEMDNAVAAAYGWDDLDLGHDFHETSQDIRFTISETARREVLGRLLELNHERYEEEQRQAAQGKAKSGNSSGKARAATGKTTSRAVKEEAEQYRLL